MLQLIYLYTSEHKYTSQITTVMTTLIFIYFYLFPCPQNTQAIYITRCNHQEIYRPYDPCSRLSCSFAIRFFFLSFFLSSALPPEVSVQYQVCCNCDKVSVIAQVMIRPLILIFQIIALMTNNNY